MSKNKSIEETYSENKKNTEELITQLKLAGVKDKTIEKMLKEIAEYQRKIYTKQAKDIIQNMRKTILDSIGEE